MIWLHQTAVHLLGDGSKWLITTKDAVTEGEYVNSPRKVIKSSLNSNPHTLKWYLRRDQPQEPWISLVDYGQVGASGLMLYGQNSNNGFSESVRDNNGANVYIRYKGLRFYYSTTVNWFLSKLLSTNIRYIENPKFVTLYQEDGFAMKDLLISFYKPPNLFWAVLHQSWSSLAKNVQHKL